MQENAQNTPAQSDTPQSVSANAPQNKCDTAQPAQASVPDRSCGAEVVNGAQAARQSTSLWRAAFRATVPVLCGSLALGSAFGLLLNAAGYGALAAGAMSVVLYAGSGQFLAAQMLASGATLVEMALATFFLNARHMVYGPVSYTHLPRRTRAHSRRAADRRRARTYNGLERTGAAGLTDESNGRAARPYMPDASPVRPVRHNAIPPRQSCQYDKLRPV